MKQLLSMLELARLDDPGASEEQCIRAVARSIIAELGIVSPPVNVRMVASYLDINDVVVDHELTVAGCLVCGERSQIRVRGADSAKRRRFTICHECAHTFFPGFSLQPQYRCAPEGSGGGQDRGLEGLCDLAAAELLLPEVLFMREMIQMPGDLETIEQLSDQFDASLVATGNRFVTLSNEPTALLIFEERNKPSEKGTLAVPRMRLQSSFCSGDWPFFRRHKSVVEGDPFDRASQGEIVSESFALISDIAAEPVTAEVHAQLYPYSVGGLSRRRVLALVRRPNEAA